MASETTAATNTTRQNEHPYLKKRRKCVVLFIYFLIKKNLYLKSYLFNSKIAINALIQEGLCAEWLIRGGGGGRRLIRGVRQKGGQVCGGAYTQRGDLQAKKYGTLKVSDNFEHPCKILVNHTKLRSVESKNQTCASRLLDRLPNEQIMQIVQFKLYNLTSYAGIVYSPRFDAVAASPDQIKSQRNYCPFFS